jgi:hypothetical protein
MTANKLNIVAAALCDEKYYGNGKPNWKEGRRQRPAQSRRDARKAREALVNRLRRFGKNNPDAISVANRIDLCRPRDRCMSGACPECARAWQRWFVSAAPPAFPTADKSYIFNLILAAGKASAGTLRIRSANILKRSVIELLSEAGMRTAILGLDLSFNEGVGHSEPHWLLHYRGHTPDLSALNKLRTLLSPDSRIKRPLLVGEWDGKLAGYAYTPKPRMVRRQSYVDNSQRHRKPFRNTRERPLRGVEAVELSIFPNQLGLRKRLLLKGIGFYRLRSGGIAMRVASIPSDQAA